MPENIGHVEALEKEFGEGTCSSERRVDQAWCSDLCKKKIRDAVLERYPCPQKFTRVDVHPLYAKDPCRYYRVTLWVNNWAADALGAQPEIWKTFSVVLEGIERTVVSIAENKKPRMELGVNGKKLMDEVKMPQEAGL
jgi:hypothetical protein